MVVSLALGAWALGVWAHCRPLGLELPQPLVHLGEVLLDGDAQLLLAQQPAASVSLQDGVPQRLMLGVDGSGRRATERLTLTPVEGSSSATLTATLADPAVDAAAASPTSLELRVYIRSDKVGCPLDAVDRAWTSAGGIATLGVPKSLAEYDACCKGSPGCEL